MAAKSILRPATRLLSGLCLTLCLIVLVFWLAGLRAVRPDPLWLHVNADHGRIQYAIGSLDGQMELRRVRKDEQSLSGPHCGERAACAAFERQFPSAVRYEYLGCAVGREPVIDVVGRDEQLIKTGTAWFMIVPQGLAVIALGIFPAILIVPSLARRWRRTPARRYRKTGPGIGPSSSLGA